MSVLGKLISVADDLDAPFGKTAAAVVLILVYLFVYIAGLVLLTNFNAWLGLAAALVTLYRLYRVATREEPTDRDG